MKLRLVLLCLLCIGTAFAQRVTFVKKNSATYKAIMRVAKAEFQKNAAWPIKTPSCDIRRAGDWAYLDDILAFADPKHVGDGEGVALLRLKKGKWVIVEAVVGSGGFPEAAQEWKRKYKLPNGLVD